MLDEMMLECKRLLALLTLVWPLARMQQRVRVQAVLVRERLPALLAHVRPNPRVDLHVRRQVVLHGKRLPAIVTMVILHFLALLSMVMKVRGAGRETTDEFRRRVRNRGVCRG